MSLTVKTRAVLYLRATTALVLPAIVDGAVPAVLLRGSEARIDLGALCLPPVRPDLRGADADTALRRGRRRLPARRRSMDPASPPSGAKATPRARVAGGSGPTFMRATT